MCPELLERRRAARGRGDPVTYLLQDALSRRQAVGIVID